MRTLATLLGLLLLIANTFAQPEIPVEEWTGKTILFVGAHPDEDSYANGTLSMLNANGNEIYIAMLTTGKVGTQDTKLSMSDLANIRLGESRAAMEAMGISGDHYINMGYDDGMLEFEDKKEIVASLVRLIRYYKPDVIFSIDPGKGEQRWHKSDSRTASYLTADAARAAVWPLLFQGQITVEGLEAHTVKEFMLYDAAKEDINTWVDISEFKEMKINATSKYISQWSSAWYDYKGPVLSEEEAASVRDNISSEIDYRDGKPVEGFRYYSGLPDYMGR